MQKAINQSTEPQAAVTAGPFITIIEPFEHRMSAVEDLKHRIKCAADQASKELAEKFPLKAGELTGKLYHFLETLNYAKQKSILIILGDQLEKAIYFNEPVVEKIQVSDVFDAEDLYLEQEPAFNFLLLLLSANSAKLFLGDVKLDHLDPVPIPGEALERDLPERISNFSDMDERKQITIKKFFRQIDESLSQVLKSHPFPLILACTNKSKGYFNEISSNREKISEFLEGNYEDATESELLVLLQPALERLQKEQQLKLINQLEEAHNRHEAVEGIHEVLNAAKEGKGRMLLIEKDYKELIGGRDLVPLTIAQVMSYGGEVKFLTKGILMNHSPVSMILKYK